LTKISFKIKFDLNQRKNSISFPYFAKYYCCFLRFYNGK